MPTILVTGTSGYIGKRFVALARDAGHTIVSLEAPAQFSTHVHAWRLGEQPAAESFEGVDAVVHLAHAWSKPHREVTGAGLLNLSGSELLARAALSAGVKRFVFASSVSARAQALNVYGRVKYATEECLLSLPDARHAVFCARIGLVYGVDPAGQYGRMLKLATLTPILPMTGLDRQVQPIHVDEVCRGLLTLALGPEPTQPIFVLASPKSMTFGAWLRLLHRAQTGKDLVLIPLPPALILSICRSINAIPFVPKIDQERILGLAGTRFCESAKDLQKLGLVVDNPVLKLIPGRLLHRTLIREARVLLHYLLGRKPPRKAIIRLVRAMKRRGDAGMAVPRLIEWQPALLRFIDPVSPARHSVLALHLHLATMVAETLPRSAVMRTRYSAILLELFLEVVAIPFRTILGR